MSVLAVCCAAVSAWLSMGPARRTRPSRVRRAGVDHPPSMSRFVESGTARAIVCAAGLGLIGQLFGGPAAALLALPAGLVLSVWLGRLESPSAARAREEIERDLPLAADLLAACAAVGKAPQDALPVVSGAVGAALGARLNDVTRRLTLGADPAAEWSRLSHDPQLGDLGRTMLRSIEHGVPVAQSLARLAEDRRRERRTTTQLRAQSVGVKAAGPLALCFLPAFMIIGVVPTVAGGFQRLFG